MEFNLAPRTVYLGITGSHAYGMARPESDVDVRGVAIAPRSYYTGFLHRFKQSKVIEPGFWKVIKEGSPGDFRPFRDASLDIEGTKDIEIAEIQKFCWLATDSNPNVLEQLFLPEECILFMSEPFREIWRWRDLFLSQRVRHSFAGYAHSQIKRIRGHRRWLQNPPKAPPARVDFDLPEEMPIPKEQWRAAESMIERRINDWLINPDEEIPVTVLTRIREAMVDLVASVTLDQDPDYMILRAAGHQLGFSDNFLDLLDKERRYRNAKKDWKHYETWCKERNPVRAELEAKWGYDTKHASHVVRLARMCEEMLTTGKLHVDRRSRDADELLAIRAGAWSYEKLEEFADDIDRRMDRLYGEPTCPLPREPNRPAIDAICSRIVECYSTEGFK